MAFAARAAVFPCKFRINSTARLLFFKVQSGAGRRDLGFFSKRNNDSPVQDSAAARRASEADRGRNSARAVYVRPRDLTEKLQRIVLEHCKTAPKDWKSVMLDDRKLKYEILAKCMQNFRKDIPNAHLMDINTAADVLKYFDVDDTASGHIERLATHPERPRNLTVLPEGQPYDAGTDDFFNGRTAFPGRKTVKSSLQHRKQERKSSR